MIVLMRQMKQIAIEIQHVILGCFRAVMENAFTKHGHVTVRQIAQINQMKRIVQQQLIQPARRRQSISIVITAKTGCLSVPIQNVCRSGGNATQLMTAVMDLMKEDAIVMIILQL
jgi:hypothetical protein